MYNIFAEDDIEDEHESVPDQDSSDTDSDSSQSSSDTEDDPQPDPISKEETELQLLGNIKSKDGVAGADWKEERKRRKQESKYIDPAKKMATLKQEQVFVRF